MTTNWHTAISVGAAANAATFNTPLGALDEAITNAQTGVYNVLEYGAAGNGSTDDTTAIQAALNAAHATDGGTVYFPDGDYYVDAKAGGVSVYSHTHMVGSGKARIYCANLLSTDSSAGNYVGIKIPTNEHDIEITGFEFYGDNSPFTWYDNLEQDAIYITIGTTGADINIHHCAFRNLYGFTVHAPGDTELRTRVTHCVMIDCSNGMNVNSDYADLSHNNLYRCEGIEASGSYATITNNIIRAPVIGISIGGKTAENADQPGAVVTNNVILDTVLGTGSASCGISVNDAVQGALIANNILVRTYGPGIQIVAGAYNAISNVTIANNIIRSSGATAGSSGWIGIYANSANVSGLHITGNHIHDHADDTNQTAAYGISVESCDDVDISNNVIFGMLLKDISCNAATDITLGRNRCDPAKIEFINSCTLSSNYYNTNTFMQAGIWLQDNVSASQTGVALTMIGSERTETLMVRAGSIVGIAVYSNDGRTAGTLSVEPTINGTACGLAATLTEGHPSRHETTQSPFTDALVAGDRVGVKITTDGSWAPTTADITVVVLVDLL